MLSPRKQERRHILRDILITAGLLLLGALLSTLLMIVDHTGGFASMIFVLMVVLVARLTDGYVYGVAASFFSVILVNYAFTYPYGAVDFTIAGYPLTFLTMLSVSLIVSAMTSQIKRQEKQRIEAEREALRANLLRAVSHDLRTPLTSIVGSTSAILENADVLSRQQKAELLRGVRDEAQWLIRMVENLLSITRMGDPAARIDKELQAVEEVLASVAAKFQQRFPAIHLELAAPEEPLFVPMDAILIEQVLMNLLENAACHGHCAHIRLFVELEGQMAVFTVQDDGQGIAPDVLPTIFTPHLRSQTHSTDARRNMGIGLSVCLSIVKAHGGVMSAANAPEGGAVFRFTLPVEELSMEDTSHEDQGKILIIEDEANISSFIAAVLEANDYDTMASPTGSKAITMITSHCPDLILLDLGLPDMDGISIIRFVREWSTCPIIVISARNHERDKVEALDAGADDYIVKPFGTSELLARIRTAIRHTRTHLPNGSIAQSGQFKAMGLVIDYDKHQVLVDGQSVHLTQNEYKLVSLLGKYAGRVLTYDFIIRQLWGPKAKSDNQILRVNMANIRRKIEKNPAEPKYIFTEIGVGYRMVDPD